MRRFFAALGLAAASSLLAGCPVYSAESCVDQSDCANGFICDVGRNECVVDDYPTSSRCSVSSDCGANHFCRQDGVCAPIDDCRWSGCPGGYVCEATSSAAPRCVVGSSGKGGGNAAGSGGSSPGGSGGSPTAGAGGEPAGGAAGESAGGQSSGGQSSGGSTQGGASGAATAGSSGSAQGGGAGEAQGGSAQGGSSQGGAAQGGSSQGGSAQAGAAGSGQAGAAQGGASQAGSGGSGQAGSGDAGAGGSEAAGAGGSSAGSGGATAGGGGSTAGTGGSAGATQAACDDGGLASASGSLQLVSQATAAACTGGLSSKPLEGKLAIAGGKGAPGDTWTFEAVGVTASQPEIRCNEGGVVCSFSFQRTEGTSTTRYTSTAAPFTVKVTIWNDASFIGTAEQVKTIRRVTVPGQTDQQVVEGVTLVMVATAG